MEFLEAGFAAAFKRAGMGEWSIPGGCLNPLIPLKIERRGGASSGFAPAAPLSTLAAEAIDWNSVAVPAAATTAYQAAAMGLGARRSSMFSANAVSSPHPACKSSGGTAELDAAQHSRLREFLLPEGAAGTVRIYPRHATSFEALVAATRSKYCS